MPRDGTANLKTPTTEQARKIGAIGGKASGESRKKKKILSEIYSDLLAERLTIQDQTFEAGEFAKLTVLKILARGDSASATMLKEIREATEGSKLELLGEVTYRVIPGKRPDADA